MARSHHNISLFHAGIKIPGHGVMNSIEKGVD